MSDIKVFDRNLQTVPELKKQNEELFTILDYADRVIFDTYSNVKS